MLARSRAMRTEMSDCERRLWWRLRNRQLAGCKFRRQHPVGPFIADFACIEARLIIEVDGETHGNDEQESRDAQRAAWLERHGWRVLRFWSTDVAAELDWVVERIWEAITGELADGGLPA